MPGLQDLLNYRGRSSQPQAMVPLDALPIPDELKLYYRSQGIQGLSKEAADSIMSQYAASRGGIKATPSLPSLRSLLPSMPSFADSTQMYSQLPLGVDASTMGLRSQMPSIPNTEGQGDLYSLPQAPQSPRAPTASRQTLMRVPTGWEEGPSPEAMQNPYEGTTGNEGQPFRQGPQAAAPEKNPQLSGPLALLAAGLGILGSKSPYGLQAIGEGGLKGIETYAKLSQAEKDTALKERLTTVHEKTAETERIGIEALSAYRAKANELAAAKNPAEIAKLQADTALAYEHLKTVSPENAYRIALTKKAEAETENIPEQRKQLMLVTARDALTKTAQNAMSNLGWTQEQADRWIDQQMNKARLDLGLTPPSLGSTKIVPGSTWSPQGWIAPK